jgi:hypothetical protein
MCVFVRDMLSLCGTQIFVCIAVRCFAVATAPESRKYRITLLYMYRVREGWKTLKIIYCSLLFPLKASKSTNNAPINSFQNFTTHGGPFPETKS